MSRAVVMKAFGGIENLQVQEVAEPHAEANQIRVKVAAAGLNPMDWVMTANDEAASRFGLTLPSGFGTDFAGTVDEVGADVTNFAVGDRVFGCALSRAVAEYVVVDPEGNIGDGAHHTPSALDDKTAATLDIAGRTASAALDAIDLKEGDTVLIGGAAGGVGVFAVQLAKLFGARVIGTASASSFDYLRNLGAEPVAYGEGLVDRVRAIVPNGVTAATDLFGTEVVHVARALGVPDDRISVIAAQVEGVTGVSGANAKAGTLERIAELVVNGELKVPIAAEYGLDRIRDAVELQAGRHAKGKVVVTLSESR
jgi:NADPH:quinone reductase-like Zn-dependent oxidoreductase